MAESKFPTSLGDVGFDCILKREENYTADVQDYAVEGGTYTSDGVMRKALTVEFTAIITDMPVTWRNRWKEEYGGTRSVRDVIERLKELQNEGELLTFVTPRRTYENMVITNMAVPEEDYLNAAELTIQLKQISFAKGTSTVSGDYEYSGITEEDAGTTNTTKEVAQIYYA